MFAKILIFSLFTLVNIINAEPETVVIQKWQYCAGCKALVETYARILAQKVKQMKSENIENPVYEMDGEDICSHNLLNVYQPFVTHSCIKIMNEHKMEFLSAFEGHATSDYDLMKGSIYDKMKDVC
jgi:hypothetical protein